MKKVNTSSKNKILNTKMINSDFFARGPQPHRLNVDFKSLDEKFIKNFNLELLYHSYLNNKIYEKLSKVK
jgi:hypothetical protein